MNLHADTVSADVYRALLVQSENHIPARRLLFEPRAFCYQPISLGLSRGLFALSFFGLPSLLGLLRYL
jgi:hypothetical protein